MPVPPPALLSVPGQPASEGAVGTFTWDGFASDAPWLPGNGPVLVAPDIEAHVRLRPGSRSTTGSASYAPLDGTTVDDSAASVQTTGVDG